MCLQIYVAVARHADLERYRVVGFVRPLGTDRAAGIDLYALYGRAGGIGCRAPRLYTSADQNGIAIFTAYSNAAILARVHV